MTCGVAKSETFAQLTDKLLLVGVRRGPRDPAVVEQCLHALPKVEPIDPRRLDVGSQSLDEPVYVHRKRGLHYEASGQPCGAAGFERSDPILDAVRPGFE